MSISALFGAQLVLPKPTQSRASPPLPSQLPTGLMIECSSRPQKKATAHHMKTRPKKSQPWDIKRGPAVYPPLPPLPPDWTLAEAVSSTESVEPQPPLETTTTTTTTIES